MKSDASVGSISLVVDAVDSILLGESFLRSELSAGRTRTIEILNSRLSGSQSSDAAILHSGAGELDGLILTQNTFSDYARIVYVNPNGTTGRVANVEIRDNMIDQVDGKAIHFDLDNVTSGVNLNGAAIVNNRINGYSLAASTNPIIELDCAAGALIADSVVFSENYVYNVLASVINTTANVDADSLIIRDNIFQNYNTGNIGSYLPIEIDGTFDYLEIADNFFDSANAPLYLYYFDTPTITKSKIEGNTYRTAPSSARANTMAYETGDFCEIAFTVAATVVTIVSKTVPGGAVTRSGLGLYRADIGAVGPMTTCQVHVRATLGGTPLYGVVSGNDTTSVTVAIYDELGVLTDPTACTITFSRAAY
jgi:hypothetical protein